MPANLSKGLKVEKGAAAQLSDYQLVRKVYKVRKFGSPAARRAKVVESSRNAEAVVALITPWLSRTYVDEQAKQMGKTGKVSERDR